MTENTYQRMLKVRLEMEFPGCLVLKQDPSIIQGIPDLLILHKDKWAALEVKISDYASHRPNQDYYVEKMNKLSYAAFIYPSIEDEVFDELHKALGA